MSLKLIKRGNVYHVTGAVYGETLRKTTKTSDKKLAEEIMSRWEREIRDRHVFGTRAAVGSSGQQSTLERAYSQISRTGSIRFATHDMARKLSVE